MAHKRQRTENGDCTGSSRQLDEFHITFGSYGTIKLAKVSLEAFPTSLLSVTLLEDGVSDHELYVPIGRGDDSFPLLIKNTYDKGAPSEIPPLGLSFDLFVRWLKYLGLATPGRGISTESEAAKRVSFFVETMLETAHEKANEYKEVVVPHPQRITGRGFSGDFINMPVDIERYLGDLVPFEFARRGVHVTVTQQFLERNVQRDDVNLSELLEIRPRRDGAFFVQRKPTAAKYEPGRVTGAYMFNPRQSSPFEFKHDGHPYVLSWCQSDSAGWFELRLTQLDAGCSYDGRENLERFLVMPRGGTDFVAEFKKGNLVYSSEKHGKPLWGRTEEIHHCMLMHGMYDTDVDHEDLGGACLLVVECEKLLLCMYNDELFDTDDMISVVWKFELEESPEWALHT